ncbi:unnamed protein product [Aspergillus oryzae]|uniref:Unnamed protein product n=2 Tax=Aspergillus oryzae TaxID=5062 RepID=A0AAN5BPI2_ASPOZ|nr:unnamed protein product [Aspergillus oryzae]GMF88398.1 unnamed protein product [Aspergillus oryzae]GMG00829.1 unnamed protein product [Aspergillus oryzae]GMG26103.1 unnamed protein product [Aspergillus oryzae]GMG49382.1 unnamed protein product [Aspergillus oryzae var. brunneus]
MPHPQKGRSRPRGSDEEFVLFLQGVSVLRQVGFPDGCLTEETDSSPLSLARTEGSGTPNSLAHPTSRDRLSTNGWEGQSLVVTLARTSSPTRPIAGPTKSPHCVIPSDYVAGYSTPPRVSQNMAVPPSPISPE